MRALIPASAVVALGLAAGGYFAGQGVVESRTADRFLSVKGLAERAVEADMAAWEVTFSASGEELPALTTVMEQGRAAVAAFFREQGFRPEEQALRYMNVTDNRAQSYNENASMPRYTMTATVALRSANAKAVQAAAARQAELVARGVLITGSNGPYYAFTRLNDVKPAMLEEAVKNARKAARQFAGEADASLGDLRGGQQGQFTILPRDSTAQEQESLHKIVRVVSTVEYSLR
jgi:uncharacterized protein